MFETSGAIGFEWRATLEAAELDAGELSRVALRSELQQRSNQMFSVRARLVT